jgi:hypothetical protein
VELFLVRVGAYFCMNMMLITLSSFLAVFVICAHIRGDRKNQVPRWLKTASPGCEIAYIHG